MYETQTADQVKRPAIVVKFWNHSKTVVDPEEHDMYVRSDTDPVIITQ